MSPIDLEAAMAAQAKDSRDVLTQEELQLVRQTCVVLGASILPVSPGAESTAGLVGGMDAGTDDFKEGIISLTMRHALKQKPDKQQWIVLDGAVERRWVETMNSVLDDNAKMTLITGESVPLDGRMRMVFETVDLASCSPATVSRCSLVHV